MKTYDIQNKFDKKSNLENRRKQKKNKHLDHTKGINKGKRENRQLRDPSLFLKNFGFKNKLI